MFNKLTLFSSVCCRRAGASSGIGREVALECARRGARLVIGCRNAVKAEAVSAYIKRKSGNDEVHCVMVDLASMTSVRQLVHVCSQQRWTIDILINNAGTTSSELYHAGMMSLALWLSL